MTKLNPQGLSRREESLMRCIVATPGHTIVSSDLGAGEPSVTAHYSGDPNYLLAVRDMIGKPPYFRNDGLLIIDDIYLMVASKYPDWAGSIRDAFNSTYDGLTFSEKWLDDPEYLAKKVLGDVRGKAKPLGLGISYGLGPKNMVLFAAQNGFDFPLADAKKFYQTYWDTFPRVRLLGKTLERRYKQQGYIQNDFGYCLYPSEPYKCLNYLIQSTVTGLLHVFKSMLFERLPWVHFLVEIHDEILIEIPTDRLTEAKEIFYQVVDEFNDSLNWKVRLRFGWAEGKDWYEAK